jgi:hypothetical protein
VTEKRKYRRKAAVLTWDQLDPKDHLDTSQRMAVDYCLALIDDVAGRRGAQRLWMIDYIATFMLYERFAPIGKVEEAATTHANNIMNMADDIDELCRG